MSRMASETLRLRRLGPADSSRVAQVAAGAFQDSGFYLRALGLDRRELARYWEAFFRLALDDRQVRVFALEDDAGQMLAGLAVAYQGFPQPVRGVGFLLRLLRVIGPGAWLRYVGFVRAYQRVMHRPAREHGVEARGLWLFVQPDARRQWLGSTLVHEGIAAVGQDGKTLMTGFVDAGNRPLLAFYRRLGFSVSSPVSFRGLTAATIELWVPERECPAC